MRYCSDRIKLCAQLLVTICNFFFLGFFSEENELHKYFMKAADQKRTDFNFAHSIDSNINKDFGYDKYVLFALLFC